MRFRISVLASLIFVSTTTVVNAQLPGRYVRYAQALLTLTELQASHPGICCLDTMGYSTRDSVPMLRFKMSDNVRLDEDEPAVFFCGGVHADEVLGVEVVMWFIQDILRRYDQEDTIAARYINNLEIYCVPFINPEGHIVVEGGHLLWRKNKCDNDHNGVFNFHDGVDNNRNYDFAWSIDNQPDAIVPESLQYKGTAPFTQSENVAMAAFGQRYKPLVALDYHSPTYGRSEVAYYPWYWYPNVGGHGFGPDEALMYDICRQYCSLVIDDRGDSTYEARRALVDKGDMKTYFYGNFGTAAFSVEISDTTIQDTLMVDSICRRHLPSQYFLLQRALGPGITGIIRDSLTLEPLEAEVQVLEHINADILPRLSRPDYGCYRRLLAPGTYTLRFLKTGYYTRTISGVTVGSNGPREVNALLRPTNPVPPAPGLVFPPPDTIISDTMPVFAWHRSPYATRYLIEVFPDADSVNPVLYDSLVIDTNYATTAPLTDSLYSWRVKGGNTNGWGLYSERWRFAISTPVGLSDDSVLPSIISLSRNYPNPFNAQTLIPFNLPAGIHGRLSIYDIAGRLVKQYDVAGSSGGSPQGLIWDGQDSRGAAVKSGVYFCRLSADGKLLTRKMILLK